MFKTISRLTLSSALVCAFGFGASAQAIHPMRAAFSDTAVHNVTFEAIDNSGLFWNKEVAACDNAAVLDRVRALFSYQVHNVPELPDVAITAFRKIHQHRFIPARDISSRDKRYCGATADFSDGRSRMIYYLIEDEAGFASVGDGVKFCVSGFDRWRVYNGYCRLID